MQSYSSSLTSLCLLVFALGCSEANEPNPVEQVHTKTVEAPLVDMGEPN